MNKLLKLGDKHPTAVKIRKLEDIMTKMGLSISVNYQDQIVINDTEHDVEIQYRDIEQSPYSNDSTSSFPYFLETKFILTKSIQ